MCFLSECLHKNELDPILHALHTHHHVTSSLLTPGDSGRGAEGARGDVRRSRRLACFRRSLAACVLLRRASKDSDER